MAQKGGARPGAGRKKGVHNRASAAREAEVKASGKTPLDVMIDTMRELYEANEKVAACAIAKDAAPYIHPRLASLEAKVDASVIVEVIRFGAARNAAK